MAKKTIKPQQLRKGDTIGLIAPSSPVLHLDDIKKAGAQLKEMGFNVLYGKHIKRKNGFLAGRDEQRLEDLHGMFAHKKVAGIFALRGGYGSARLLNNLDWKLIGANPKVLLGHSDLTALLLAIHQGSGLVTFCGPMAGYDLGRNPSRFKEKWLRSLTCAQKPGIRLPSSPPGKGRRLRVVCRHGSAEGELVGGNLSIICSLLGTPYEIDTRGRLLFIEDVDEDPYRIDRMLTQLMLAGKLRDAAGVIVGYCLNCESSGRMKKTYSLSHVLKDRLARLNKPVVYGFPIGHEPEKITLPLGIRARLETKPPRLTLLEPAVRS